MRLLAIGDVCGEAGCEAVREILPKLKKKKKIDAVIINGENSAQGNGIIPFSAEHLFISGADVITGGNHSLRRKEIFPLLDSNPMLLRPDNLTDAQYGSGYCVADFGSFIMAVINLSGKVYLDKLEADNPFLAVDKLLDRAKEDGANIIVVDFHAEATSEKRAMGFYLDGKVSAVFGTHTHVQTADAQILPKGTGYITDLGMTGPINSVLGVKTEIIINRLRNNDLSRFEAAEGKCMLNGCIFDIDNATGKTVAVERIGADNNDF